MEVSGKEVEGPESRRKEAPKGQIRMPSPVLESPEKLAWLIAWKMVPKEVRVETWAVRTGSRGEARCHTLRVCSLSVIGERNEL